MDPIAPYRSWTGTIEELSHESENLLGEVGRGDLGAPSIRLIRDYAQRGILSPAQRRGKEAVYNVQHLKELVAARILVTEGIPLAKIAEQFERDRDIAIVTMGVASCPEPAPFRAQRAEPAEQISASLTEGAAREADAESLSSNFMRRTIESTSQRRELRQLIAELDSDPDQFPQRLKAARIAITDWCELLINPDRLARLGPAEIEALTQAIAHTLSDPRFKKENRS